MRTYLFQRGFGLTITVPANTAKELGENLQQHAPTVDPEALNTLALHVWADGRAADGRLSIERERVKK